MKRAALIVVTVLFMISGMLNCFCADADNIGIFSDFTLLDQLESKQLMESIEFYARELEYQYNEGASAARLMGGYEKPENAKNQPVKTYELLYALGYKGRSIDDRSMLFRDGIFLDYYRLRTEKALEEYKKSGKMDLSAFMGRSRQEFDIFMKEVQKDISKKDRLILLLQDKLIDKMYSEDMDNKSSYFEKVLELRLASNSDKRNQSLYELMESRVRLKLLQELVDINRRALKAYLNEQKVIINSDTSGVFSFRYISDIEKRTILEYSVYMAADNPDYKLLLPLGRLAAIYGKATFAGKQADVRVMSRDSIWDKVGAGEGEELELNLREAYINESEIPSYDILSIIPDNKKVIDAAELSERGKKLENSSSEAQNLAQEITKDLCALSSYTDLKGKGIYNSYTDKFEANEGAWLANLNKNLNSMNKLTFGKSDSDTDTDFIGFLSYIRQYVDYYRDCAAAGLPENSSVLAFRDTVLQFRQVDEGALWITDMLYKTKYLH